MVEEACLAPLSDGATVAVIGGGPGGCATAMTLLRLGRACGKQFNVHIYEPKQFGQHYPDIGE